MKKTTYSTFGLILACHMASAAFVMAADSDSKEKAQRKTVTIINAEGTADGRSEISREAVKECLVSLPKLEALEPEVTTESRYLKEINGEAGKSDWVKLITAKITINYIVYRKDLLIVATHSVEGKEPAIKEVEKHLPQMKEFVSNPADGDTYAGRSNRQYYFTKSEDAIKDVKARAMVWLKQQAPLLCSETK